VPRSGRPQVLSTSDKRFLWILIKRNPFIRYREINERLRSSLSRTTLLKMIKESGYGHWKARKRPRLQEEHARKRLAWARVHRNWTVEQWRKVVWSDECSVELGKGKQGKWVFRLNRRNEKWKKEYITPYNKSKGMSVMVWVAIWGGEHTPIQAMTRDPDAARNGYSAASYLEILQANFRQISREGLLFMQDNASIHTAHLIRDWFFECGISAIQWPPYSPDLNPIEHAWAKLKERIYQLDPDIESRTGPEDEVKEYFIDLIQRAWEDLGQDYFDQLVASMPRRVEAVIDAQGWYTKY